jgi:hypothetical protein
VGESEYSDHGLEVQRDRDVSTSLSFRERKLKVAQHDNLKRRVSRIWNRGWRASAARPRLLPQVLRESSILKYSGTGAWLNLSEHTSFFCPPFWDLCYGWLLSLIAHELGGAYNLITLARH